MPHIQSVAEGDGITTRSRRLLVLDPDDLSDAEMWRQFLASTHDGLNAPWGNKKKLVEAVQARWEQLKSKGAGTLDAARPYGSESWYIRMACARIKLIEKYINSRPWEAVTLAIEFGELLAELSFKMDYEKAALLGTKTLESQRIAAQSLRRQSAVERFDKVESFIASGDSTRRALKQAAEYFAVAEGTIRKDYYCIKNSVPPPIE